MGKKAPAGTSTAKKAVTKNPARNTAPKASTSGAGNAPEKAKSFFYVVYVDTYIDDETILPRGIYRTSKKIERLEASKPSYVAKFEGKIGDKVLHSVAETLKVSLTDDEGDYRDSKDILDEIVQDI